MGLADVATGSHQFTNRVYAPKWVNIIGVLGEMKDKAPNAYVALKQFVWAHVFELIRKEEEAGKRAASTSGIGDEATADDEFVAWDDIEVIDVNAQPSGEASSSGTRGIVDGGNSGTVDGPGELSCTTICERERGFRFPDEGEENGAVKPKSDHRAFEPKARHRRHVTDSSVDPIVRSYLSSVHVSWQVGEPAHNAAVDAPDTPAKSTAVTGHEGQGLGEPERERRWASEAPKTERKRYAPAKCVKEEPSKQETSRYYDTDYNRQLKDSPHPRSTGSGRASRLVQLPPTGSVRPLPVDQNYDEGVAEALMGLPSGLSTLYCGPVDRAASVLLLTDWTRQFTSSVPHNRQPSTSSRASPPTPGTKCPLSTGPDDRSTDMKHSRVGSISSTPGHGNVSALTSLAYPFPSPTNASLSRGLSDWGAEVPSYLWLAGADGEGLSDVQPGGAELSPIMSARLLLYKLLDSANRATVTIAHGADVDFDDGMSDISEYSDDDPEPPTDATELERLLEAEEHAPLRTTHLDDRMLTSTMLQCAAVSVTLGELNTVQNFDQPNPSELEAFAGEDSLQIHRSLSDAAIMVELPPPNIAPEPVQPNELFLAPHGNLDASPLVDLRRAHESERAAKGVRTSTYARQGSAARDNDRDANTEQASTRRAIIREMSAIIREQQDNVGTTSGLNRTTRIQQGPAPTGNSANAALAAGQRAAALVQRRAKVFLGLKIPYAKDLADARVGKTTSANQNNSPLMPGDYSVVVDDSGRIMVFEQLENRHLQILEAIKQLKSRKKRQGQAGTKDDASDTDVDEDE
ncbi:uncharacterized protein B0H18DRAFT_1124521 [Fomitopsis serialis]|uniref:uncharacterized protein n=1 Tax=Fomitopsis serialis TaxID=139415 RepID=UPI002008A723|nr:uncharacterized protein B0H18DRAFT_1124521 [Neoantrodia serialis]KAH9915978.1 hypothetical protein B0H18DRAFT_1124521 [Neoantrodia serialis]